MAEEKEKSRVPRGLQMRSVQLEDPLPDKAGNYAFKNGVLAFVDDDGTAYVTPGTRIKMEVLQEAGFKNPRPQMEVPYSDGSTKSKYWIRRNMPAAELHRTVEENRMPKVDGKVKAGMIKINRDGLDLLDDDFLRKRCARTEGKHYSSIGLIGSFRNILGFTDWKGNCYVTPFTGRKVEFLEKHGYVYVESMIQVPHAMNTEENRTWLAENIPPEEWGKSQEEVSEEKEKLAVEKARQKIEELGIKELPEEFLESGAVAEEENEKYIGLSGVHNGILSFTDPNGKTYVTPATTQKIQGLVEHGYQFMGSSIRIPHSLKTEEDIKWLKENIDQQYWDKAREKNRKEREEKEIEETEARRLQYKLENIPAELIDKTIKTDVQQMNYIGRYFVRNSVLGFVQPSGFVYITPVMKDKVKILLECGYKNAETGFTVPYSDGKMEDYAYIRKHLSQAEMDASIDEKLAGEDAQREKIINDILEKANIGDLPAELLERSTRTDFEDIQHIGKYVSRNEVLAFVRGNGFFYVTPAVAWKTKALKDAGYREPDELVKIPYGSGSDTDRQWLVINLPEGEIKRSQAERMDEENQAEKTHIEKMVEKKGIPSHIPGELEDRCAKTEKKEIENIGTYQVQQEWLAFVGPDAYIRLTPNCPSKVKSLTANGYTHVTKRMVVPHESASPEDIRWREENLPSGEMERTRRELEELNLQHEEKIIAELMEKKKIGTLPDEFWERCVKTEKVDVDLIGCYLEKHEMLYIIGTDRYVYITPDTPGKIKAIKEKNYSFPVKAVRLPYTSDDENDIEWIKANLPEGEYERSRGEVKEVEESEDKKKIKANMEKHKLKELPSSLYDRSADSAKKDKGNIGRIGIFRGVLAFVCPDERVFVTWFTPEKQQILEDCGYKEEGYMPIKVPYAMQDKDQRGWLIENLPEADEDEEFSLTENAI